MKLKLFASWGVLAHEYRPVYTEGVPVAEAYDVVYVDYPYPLFRNSTGDILIDLGGRTYLLREVLTNWGDDPALVWRDDSGMHRVMLKTIEN